MLDSAEVVAVTTAARNVRQYLAARARTPGLDFEIINGLTMPSDEIVEEVAYLRASDLTVLLDALGDLGSPEVKPPYAPGDGVMYLRGNAWLLGVVRNITPAGDDYEVVVDLDEGTQITRTIDMNGTGGGVAPLRDR